MQRMFDQVRAEEFPFLEGQIYLNVCSVALLPRCVQQAYGSFGPMVNGWNGEKTRERLYEMANDTRRKAAQLMGCMPGEIAFVQNTTQGITLARQALGLQLGQNVVITDAENYANCYQWKNLERQGIQLRVAATQQGGFGPGQIEPLLDERTGLVSVASVLFETGYRADLKEIAALCHSRGIPVLGDVMQSVGRIPVDVSGWGLDFASTGGHKGLLCTYGAGFAYIRQEMVERLTPATASKESMDHTVPPALIGSQPLPWHPDARKFEAGSLNYMGIYGLSAALDLLLGLGSQAIGRQVLALEEQLRAGLDGLRVLRLGPVGGKEHWSGMVIVYYPLGNETLVRQVLEEHRIHATIKPDYIRLGIDFYNTPGEMEQTAKALRQLDERLAGQR